MLRCYGWRLVQTVKNCTYARQIRNLTARLSTSRDSGILHGTLFRTLRKNLIALRISNSILPRPCHIHCQFQPTPDSKLVESAAQVVLNHLFADADDLADFAVSQPFPDKNRDLIFRSTETRAWDHGCPPHRHSEPASPVSLPLGFRHAETTCEDAVLQCAN
jgi:hypothetical protein